MFDSIIDDIFYVLAEEFVLVNFDSVPLLNFVVLGDAVVQEPVSLLFCSFDSELVVPQCLLIEAFP